MSDLVSAQRELFSRRPFGPLRCGGLRDELSAGELDFLEEALRLTPPQRLLDVPYVAGRHAMEPASCV